MLISLNANYVNRCSWDTIAFHVWSRHMQEAYCTIPNWPSLVSSIMISRTTIILHAHLVGFPVYLSNFDLYFKNTTYSYKPACGYIQSSRLLTHSCPGLRKFKFKVTFMPILQSNTLQFLLKSSEIYNVFWIFINHCTTLLQCSNMVAHDPSPSLW